MEQLIKEALGTSTLKVTGSGGGGCISNGSGYLTDDGLVFVKSNSKPNALSMFEGEKAGLEAILATGAIRAPKPLAVVKDPGSDSACLVTEWIDMGHLGSGGQAQLGQNLARMHQHNEILLKIDEKRGSFVTQSGFGPRVGATSKQFGFDIPTSCGYLSQDNSWMENWNAFYIRKLQSQVDMALEKTGDRKLLELWPICSKNIQKLLSGLSPTPAILHGDLWSGNISSDSKTNEPVIFDPASFYGHSEYDFGIAHMFGGFNQAFFKSYHSIIPKEDGFSKREPIYELFHHLNHWNHFGSSYKGGSLRLMQMIIDEK